MMDIWTWNVRYFSQGLGGLTASWRTMRQIADAIASQDRLPDVLALQEVEVRSLRGGLHPASQLERFVGCLRAAYARHGHTRRITGLYYPAHRYGPAALPLYTTGLALVVSDTVRIESHNADQPHDITHVRLPAFRRLKQKRIAGHVRVSLRDGSASLDLYNTHLSLPAFFEVGPHNVPSLMGHGTNQLEEVANLLELTGAHREEPALVVGDFNTAPGSPAHTAMVDAGWVDATHGDQHGVPTAAFLHRRMHIDHVFASPAVHCRALQVRSIDEAPFAGLSDHAPKIATLDLRGA